MLELPTILSLLLYRWYQQLHLALRLQIVVLPIYQQLELIGLFKSGCLTYRQLLKLIRHYQHYLNYYQDLDMHFHWWHKVEITINHLDLDKISQVIRQKILTLHHFCCPHLIAVISYIIIQSPMLVLLILQCQQYSQ